MEASLFREKKEFYHKVKLVKWNEKNLWDSCECKRKNQEV